MQICPTGKKELTDAGVSSRFSGRFRVMQRPKTTTTRSSVAAAAAAELEQHGGSERKETTEEGE